MLGKRQVILGILIWLLIFGVFVVLAGIGDFVETLSTISRDELAVMLAAVAVGVVSMGSCLYVLVRSLGLGLSLFEAVFLNTAVSLAHNLTPFGQAGGVPIGAAILSTRSDSNYEEFFAALSMKDLVSFVPAILVFVIGGSYILLYEQSVPDRLRPLFGIFAFMVVLICGTVLLVRQYSEVAHRLLGRLVGWVNRTIARLPFVPTLDSEELQTRLDNFSASIGEIASDRKTVVLASSLATTAFLAQGTLLWLTLGAVGVEVPWTLAVFIVPVSLLASGLPLPGGSGGVESVQILTLLAVASPDSTSTITAVVLSRGLVFWTPIVLGSLTLLTLNVQKIRTTEGKEG
ncbi:MAG: lysylphosphatidylglycerol synthase transmembrane domain-containing protein [Halovenus sp.]